MLQLHTQLHAVKPAACQDNVTTSYTAPPSKTKTKRTSLGKSGDDGPPDKAKAPFK